MAQFQITPEALSDRKSNPSREQSLSLNKEISNNDPLWQLFFEGNLSGILLYSGDSFSTIQAVEDPISPSHSKPWLVLRRNPAGNIYGGWWVESHSPPAPIAMRMGGWQLLERKFSRLFKIQLESAAQIGNLRVNSAPVY